MGTNPMNRIRLTKSNSPRKKKNKKNASNSSRKTRSKSPSNSSNKTRSKSTPKKKKKKKKNDLAPINRIDLIPLSPKRSKSQKLKTPKNINTKYTVGDHIKLSQDREAIIRYIGNVSFASGTMYGIELLHGAVGQHDGKVGKKRYFTAPKQRGLFVKESRIRRKARRRDSFSSFSLRRVSSIEFIQRKTSKSPGPKTKNKKYKITPKENQNKIKYKVKEKKERWKPPYSTNSHKNEDFKEERYIFIERMVMELTMDRCL